MPKSDEQVPPFKWSFYSAVARLRISVYRDTGWHILNRRWHTVPLWSATGNAPAED